MCREEPKATSARGDRFVSFAHRRPESADGGIGLKSGAALDAIAKANSASVYHLSIAWLLQRSPVMLPIPGTSKIAHLEENVAAAKLKLTPEEWKTIDALTAHGG